MPGHALLTPEGGREGLVEGLSEGLVVNCCLVDVNIGVFEGGTHGGGR